MHVCRLTIFDLRCPWLSPYKKSPMGCLWQKISSR